MNPVIEHSELDISAIEYGNKILDHWLKSDSGTSNMIIDSAPIRFCLENVLKTLIKLGEVPKDYDLSEYMGATEEWGGYKNENHQRQIAKCILVLSVLADKRLKVTSGI